MSRDFRYRYYRSNRQGFLNSDFRIGRFACKLGLPGYYIFLVASRLGEWAKSVKIGLQEG